MDYKEAASLHTQDTLPTRKMRTVSVSWLSFASSYLLLDNLLLFQLADAEWGFGEGTGLGDRHRAAASLADFAEGTLRALARELRGLVAETRKRIRIAPDLHKRTPPRS